MGIDQVALWCNADVHKQTPVHITIETTESPLPPHAHSHTHILKLAHAHAENPKYLWKLAMPEQSMGSMLMGNLSGPVV